MRGFESGVSIAIRKLRYACIRLLTSHPFGVSFPAALATQLGCPLRRRRRTLFQKSTFKREQKQSLLRVCRAKWRRKKPTCNYLFFYFYFYLYMKNIKQKLKFTTMKAKLFTLLAALVIAAGAMAQTTIATMETTAATIKIYVGWTGDGTLTANSVALTNDTDTQSAAITPAAGVITLTATGNVQLTYLYCSYITLTSLDVSKCTALEMLNCSGNTLTSLDVTKCTALKKLYCSFNSITLLDVSKCTALEILNCSYNTLTSLDVSKCTALTGFNCSYNTLTSLDVSKCAALEILYCTSTALTSLDVSKCAALTGLYCYENPLLTSLDVTGCTALTELFFYQTPLTSLDVSKCTALKYLYCAENALTSLDVTGCAALESLNCSSNALTSLDVTKCAALNGLYCTSNSLTSLDVTKCAELIELDCSYNLLTSLDLSNCPLLLALYADGQQIEVTASPEATKFTNPILYKNQMATEFVKIEGTPYAKGDDVTIPAGDEAVFTSTVIGSGHAFGGTITIKRVVLVTFDLQDGSPVGTSEMEVNTSVTLSPFNPVRPGYTFNGWFTAAEGGDKVTFPHKVTTDITFYAQWTFNIAVEDAETAQLTAYTTPDGIAVSGVPAGELIVVYSSNGIQVAAVAAQDGTTYIPLSAQGLYIVKAGTGTVKVVK